MKLSTGVSVVVPVYRSVDSLVTLVRRVHESLGERVHEIVMVDDGSPRNTWDKLCAIARDDDAVTALRLGRNAGQHSALLAGVRAARFAVTVTIDDDLQNPPEDIPTLLDALTADLDVVYGVPDVVAQSRWRNVSSLVARSMMSSALGAQSAATLTSFRAFRTSLREGFAEDLGPGVSLDALLSWSTARFGSVRVEHHERADGRSHYTVRSLLRFAMDTATGYSARPLQVATTLGMLTSTFGFALMAFVVVRRLMDGAQVAGFAFLASIIAMFSGVQLLTLGIVGEYLARMHFRVMRKPTYVVVERTDSTEERGEA